MIALHSSDAPKPFLTDAALPVQARGKLLKRHLCHQLNALLNELPSLHFSEIDQAFLVWGAVTLIIFSWAQFSLVSWTTQAMLDAALTGAGIAVTSGLTWAIASSAKLRWVIFLWAGLMSAGTIATAYGIFGGSALILSNLCVLWLGLCAMGYGAMAMGMKSRCFTAAFWVHLGGIAALHYTPSWQFFSSGLVIASTLFFFSVVTWDREEP